MQAIVEEDLRLRDGEFGIWSRIDDKVNDDNNLVICRPEEGKWVMLQAYPYNQSIHLLYPTRKGAPPFQIQLWKIQKIWSCRQIIAVGHRQEKSTPTDCLSKKK